MNKIINYLTRTTLLLLLLPAACSAANDPTIVYQAQNQLIEDTLRVNVKVFNQGSKGQNVSDLPFIIKLYSNQDFNLEPSWTWDAENHSCPPNFHEIDGVLISIGASNIITEVMPNESWDFGRQVPLECIPLRGKFYVQVSVEDDNSKTKMINAGEITLP